MGKGILYNQILLISGLLVSCAIPGSGKTNRATRETDPWLPPPSGAQFDFKQRCGVDTSLPEGSIVFEQTLQSLNIVSNSEIIGIKAYVEAQATTAIKSTTAGTTQITTVKVIKARDLRDQSTNMSQLITKIGAHVTANANGGTTISKGLARKDWLQLTYGDNKDFRDLLCAVTGAATVRREESGNRQYEFNPALVDSVNPMASAEQFKEELGQGRTLRVSVNLVDAVTKRQIATSPGTIVIAPVSPAASFKDALTGEVKNINADAAWQITVDFPNLTKNQDRLSGKKTFYVNHKTKRFDAIVQQATKSETMNPTLPPVVLIAK